MKVIRQPGGRLIYDLDRFDDSDEFDELTYYILDTFVKPSKRRQGIAKKMLETLFRRAKRDGARISTGLLLDDGKHLIPTLVYLATQHEVRVVP
ncbi:MAG TPA: GNAT family N-acetyltransferase [Pirellulales bacterium]|nr:GNAT family N-acetyltransferase [Pirellulales bacterium]